VREDETLDEFIAALCSGPPPEATAVQPPRELGPDPAPPPPEPRSRRRASHCNKTDGCGCRGSARLPMGRPLSAWIRCRACAGSRPASRRRAFTPSSTRGCWRPQAACPTAPGGFVVLLGRFTTPPVSRHILCAAALIANRLTKRACCVCCALLVALTRRDCQKNTSQNRRNIRPDGWGCASGCFRAQRGGGPGSSRRLPCTG
jgi:hypothetical protein